MMNIAIDVDGVFTDYEWYLDYYAKSNSINKTELDLQKRYNWTKKKELKFHIKHFVWYIINMPIRENASVVMRELKKQGHKIYIITARAYANNFLFGRIIRNILKKWLYKNNVCYDEIYFVNTHNAAKEKFRLAKELNIDCFIEDDPENIQLLKDVCNVLCMQAGYNSHMPDFEFVSDFGDLYSKINKINRTNSISDYNRIPFDEEEFEKYKSNHKTIMKTLGKAVSCFLKLEIENQNNIPESDGNIFVFNHRRSSDIPVAYLVLKNRFARLLTKKEYELSPLRFLQKPLGTIYVNRYSKISGKTSRLVMIQTILNKGNLIVFPEGTRNKTNELLLPFRYGAVRVAQITNAPIIPVVIEKVKSKKYKVRIGEKIIINQSDDIKESNDKLHNIMKEMLIDLKK